MQHPTIVVTERPAEAKRILEAIQADTNTVAILASPFYPFEFSYPRGLRARDFPFLGEPAWKLGKRAALAWNVGYVRTSDGTVEKTETDTLALLSQPQADIIFACGPDGSGAVGFHTLLEQTLGSEPAGKPRKALRLFSLDEAQIARQWAAPSNTAQPWFVQALDAGRAKRFFDFNFNTNSLAVLGRVLREVGVQRADASVSKYGLQLLYALRDHVMSQPVAEAALIDNMQHWRGTGKYSQERTLSLGSPTSYAAILEGLREAGLIEDGRRHRATWQLSATGARFLALLHPNCKDADLPYRIAQWSQSWPASRPAMARYLTTFFARQTRFQAALPAKN